MIEKFIELIPSTNGDIKVDGIVAYGNLTNDPPPAKTVTVDGEERIVLNGLNTRIACNYRVKSENGEGFEDRTKFFEYTIWGPKAKYFQTLKKGDGIFLKGQLKVEESTYTSKDGKTHTVPKETIIIKSFRPDRKNPSAEKKTEDIKLVMETIDTPF